MLKYIFIALLVAAVWGVVIWLELPWWIAIAATGVALAVVLTILIVKLVRARRASREIERALKAQAEAQARSARPDLEADIRALQGEFNRAIQALKGSRLGAKGASSALYSLPWYVIVGPPGVGKSTALRNSGLKFPFLSSRGGVSVQGVGGTRNCEWWMTSEAVILDTAGRYTTENSDREEWFAFLDLLRKYRTRRPINGVMAAVSIADIAEAHPEEVASLAREVRARIDELQTRLGVVVPVYLIFTKCDLLPGFVEMFGDLTEQDRHQIWGFTLAAANQIDVAGQCTEHFDELTALLEKRALRRLAEERSPARRDKIHEFPQYVAGLRAALARFVHEMTEANIYNETPILRGVYLSSGTQEGRPVNRIMSAIAEAFGLRPTLGATLAPPADVKSYFLGDLFRKIIFPDYRLTRLNRARTRRSRIIGNVMGTVSVLLAIAIVWLPLVSFRRNREMLTQASTAFAYVEQHIAQDTVDAIPMDRIEPLRSVVELLRGYDEDGSPWAMRMGMYQGARVYPRLRDVYADTVRRELLLPTVEQELAELRRFVMRYAKSTAEPKPDDYEEHFSRLRLYLLLTGPSQPGEPGLSEVEREWATARLVELWERPIRIAGDAASLTSIEKVARTYLEMLTQQPELAFERDAKLVEQTREILSRSDRTKAIANALVASVGGPSLTLKKMVAVSSIRNDDRIIRPAFTRKGYEEQVKPYFEGGLNDLLDPAWVLAPGNEAAEELQAEEIAAIRTEYFKQYVQEWRVFVDSIYVHVPKSRDSMDALGLLTDLTRTEPYKDLFSNIAWHTQLVDLDATEPAVDAEGETALSRELKRAGQQVANRQVGMATSRLGIGKYGVNATGIGHAALTDAMKKREAERFVADPNQADVVTEYELAYAFLALAEFGARKAPAIPEDGGPAPAAEVQPVDVYLEQLKFVRDALQEAIDDPSDKDKLAEKLKGARTEVKGLLSDAKDTRWSSTLEKLLWTPIELTLTSNQNDTTQEKQKKWCNEVVASFERTVSDGYPFNPDGQPVALADFAAFFEPDKGELWAYYDKALKLAIPLKGNHFELADLGSSSGKYRQNVANFLNAANEVSQVMFPRGADGLSVEFDVMIEGAPGIKEIVLTVDGEKVKYRNGPQVWGTLKWPGDGSPGAMVEAHGFNKNAEVQREGEWGLFQLLEEGKVKQLPGTRMFVAQWDFRDEEAGVIIQIKFRPKRADTPFFGYGGRRSFMSIFRTKHLVVPRSVMYGAPTCSVGKG